MLKRILPALTLLLLMPPIASADVRILSSSGGRVGDYLQIFAQLRASGERIIIDGPCLRLWPRVDQFLRRQITVR